MPKACNEEGSEFFNSEHSEIQISGHKIKDMWIYGGQGLFLSTMSELGERFKMEAKNIDTVSLYIRYASMIDFITIILLVDLWYKY